MLWLTYEVPSSCPTLLGSHSQVYVLQTEVMEALVEAVLAGARQRGDWQDFREIWKRIFKSCSFENTQYSSCLFYYIIPRQT